MGSPLLSLADRLRTEPFHEEKFQQNFMAEVRSSASPPAFSKGVVGSWHQQPQCEVALVGMAGLVWKGVMPTGSPEALLVSLHLV